MGPRHLQETNIQDLPEDVIHCLIYKLSLRDVLNFSSVSKQWTHLPSCMERVALNMGMSKNGIRVCPEGKDVFIRGANQFLNHYNKLRSMVAAPVALRKLVICHCLRRDSSDDLDAWISLAIRNGATDLDVILVCEHHHSGPIRPDDEKYMFPWKLLDKLPPVALKRLDLRTCIFACHLTSAWTSLEALQLCDTVLTQHDVDRIRHCFPNLKSFVLACSQVPAKLTFAGGSLARLAVLYCTSNLEQIEVIDARMLREFNYMGTSVRLNFVDPHQLTKVTFGIMNSEGVDCLFQNLRPGFPAMRSLSIFVHCETLPPPVHLYGRMYSFIKLEELKLYIHPDCGLSIQTMREVLKACPVLKTLEMMPSCTVDDEGGNGSSDFPPHKSLQFIKMSGFCGSPGNVELAKFLIQVSEALLRLVVKREGSQHSRSWHGQHEYDVIKESLRHYMKRGELVFL